MPHTSSWRTPLAVLIASCVIVTLSMGVRQTAGIFMPPMIAAHVQQGWSREVFSFAIAIQNLAWGLASPFAGALADRWGAGRTLVLGAVCYVAGLALMTVADTALALDFAAGVLVGIAQGAATYTVVMGVVGRQTPPSRRSLALGIVGAGGSFGQFAMLPIGQALITGMGWQSALWVMALAVALIVPLAWVLVGSGGGGSAAAGQSIGEALAEAVRERGFHFLFWSYFVCGFQTTFIMLHLPSYLLDRGFSANLGMMAVALVALFNIFGSFFFGWAGGRGSKPKLLAAIYGLRGVAILAFIAVPASTASVLIFAAVMGLIWLGTVPLTNGLVAQIFGVRYLSMLTGIVFFGHQIGSFVGAWLGGAIFDRTGSYQGAWLVAIGLSVFAAVLSLPISEKAVARLKQQTTAV